MNILLAPNSFRGSLSSSSAAQYLEEGILRVLSSVNCLKFPLADGGEGTVDAIVTALHGNKIQVDVHDALMRPVKACIGLVDEGKTAVIEMASASGIELLKPEERNPWLTTTFGTGELINAALDLSCTRIIIGIGGSATNDGGAGMAAALGARFTNQQGSPFIPCGGQLSEVDTIDVSALDKRLSATEILVACDVRNILTGPDGASIVFGPQKGATTEMTLKLDMAMLHYSKKIECYLGKEVSSIPGSGAAGGLGAGLMAFTGASLVSGFDLISEIGNLEKLIKLADLIVTGEGKMDSQTPSGKAIAGISLLAKKHGKPLIAVTGTIDPGAEELYNMGLHLILPLTERPLSLTDAMRIAPELMCNGGERIARIISLSRILK